MNLTPLKLTPDDMIEGLMHAVAGHTEPWHDLMQIHLTTTRTLKEWKKKWGTSQFWVDPIDSKPKRIPHSSIECITLRYGGSRGNVWGYIIADTGLPKHDYHRNYGPVVDAIYKDGKRVFFFDKAKRADMRRRNRLRAYSMKIRYYDLSE